MKKWLLALTFSGLFFLIGLATLKDYGISWDSPVHFRRGQTYLHFFLTGKLTFEDLPKYNLKKAQEDSNYHERSFYQVDDVLHTGKTLKELDMGHPPLGDILMAVSNSLFYQRLGVLEDIEGYNLFLVFSGALTVFFVFIFAYEAIGLWAAVFASIFLSTYPLFWGETHFSVKDVPETAFYTATIYFFWKAFKNKSFLNIFVSSLMAGIALGIKFNILFAFIVILFWLTYLFFRNKKAVVSFFTAKTILFFLIIFPIVVFGIFYVSWPFLWDNPIQGFLKTIEYYKAEGTNITYQPNFVFGKINLFPITWIFLTSNPLVLVSSFFSIFFIGKYKGDKKEVLVLWLVWLLTPILRVTYSGFSIYGGVRQIMEFAPAMALLAGFGASQLIQKSKLIVKSFSAVLVFTLLLAPLIRLHPNENVFFNFLAGGLKGAYDKKIPAAGNSFGNAYKGGIEWFNKNAERGAKLALIQGATSNLPFFWLRSDIDYDNRFFSGLERRGEYLMEVNYLAEVRDQHFAWEYAENFLKPVYEYQVDGVSLLKIWKNDLDHTQEEFKEIEKISSELVVEVTSASVVIDLPMQKELARVEVVYPEVNCHKGKEALVETSLDNGVWKREKDWVGSLQVGRKSNLTENGFTFYFASRSAKRVRFIFKNDNTCLSDKYGVKVFYLD